MQLEHTVERECASLKNSPSGQSGCCMWTKSGIAQSNLCLPLPLQPPKWGVHCIHWDVSGPRGLLGVRDICCLGATHHRPNGCTCIMLLCWYKPEWAQGGGSRPGKGDRIFWYSTTFLATTYPLPGPGSALFLSFQLCPNHAPTMPACL